MSQEVKVNKAKSVVGGGAGAATSVHVDAPLSDFSVQVVQADTEFKARSILSNFNSKARQDMYYFYEPAYFLVNQVVARAEGKEAAVAKYGVKRKSYTTIVYGLKQPVTDETVANADKAIERIYEDATKFVTRQFLLNKEKLFAGSLLKKTVWGADWDGVASTAAGAPDGVPVASAKFIKFSEATSNPLEVFDAAMEAIQLKSGMRPNTMVMPRTVFTALKRNSVIKTTKLYTNSNSASDDAVLDTIASHLGIPAGRIFVMDVVESNATAPAQNNGFGQGGTEAAFTITTDDDTGLPTEAGKVNQFIGGNGVLLMHVDLNSTGMYSATAAVCCQWTGLYPDGGDLGNTVFKRYREERLSAEMIEGRTAFSYHVVAPALGLYLADVI